MRPEELSVGAEGDIDERLLLEQRVEHGEDRRAVVVPLQAELLLGSGRARGGPGGRHRHGGRRRGVRVFREKGKEEEEEGTVRD